MQPKIKYFDYSYKRDDSTLSVLKLEDLGIDLEKFSKQQLVFFGPGAFGGNHSHPRTEWFIGWGNLELVWQDEEDLKHTQKMTGSDRLLLIEIPPNLPHAVINKSKTEHAFIFELSDQDQYAVTDVKLI